MPAEEVRLLTQLHRFRAAWLTKEQCAGLLHRAHFAPRFQRLTQVLRAIVDGERDNHARILRIPRARSTLGT